MAEQNGINSRLHHLETNMGEALGRLRTVDRLEVAQSNTAEDVREIRSSIRALRDELQRRREEELKDSKDQREVEQAERKADRRTYIAVTVGFGAAIIASLIGLAQAGLFG